MDTLTANAKRKARSSDDPETGNRLHPMLEVRMNQSWKLFEVIENEEPAPTLPERDRNARGERVGSSCAVAASDRVADRRHETDIGVTVGEVDRDCSCLWSCHSHVFRQSGLAYAACAHDGEQPARRFGNALGELGFVGFATDECLWPGHLRL
ncbi:MAG: hypothetical protein AAGF12_01360 [Myxococcota bacterium]